MTKYKAISLLADFCETKEKNFIKSHFKTISYINALAEGIVGVVFCCLVWRFCGMIVFHIVKQSFLVLSISMPTSLLLSATNIVVSCCYLVTVIYWLRFNYWLWKTYRYSVREDKGKIDSIS